MAHLLRPLACLAAAAALLAPVLAHADPMVNGSNRTELLDCAGAAAAVNGDGNRLVFHGDCRSLRIDGTGNRVEIDLAPGGAITVTGGGNQVLYTPIVPGPVVAAEGTGNSIAAGSGGEASAALAPPVPPAPPQPPAIAPPTRLEAGTVLLRGDNLVRDADCSGRNVLIEGSNGRFTLRGGCRSVTVQGRADTINAVLQPGARIAIGGDAVTVHYRLTGAGPPPLVTVTGSGSQALQASTSSP